MERARTAALLALALVSISLLVAGSAFGVDRRLARLFDGAKVGSGPAARPRAPASRPPEPPRAVTPAAPVVAVPPSSSGRGSAQLAVAPPDPNLVTMPDVVGMRVGAARRLLRSLGLRVTARNANFDLPIEPSEGPYYRVDSASIEAGARIPRGATVRLLGSNPEDLAEGY